MNALRFLPLLFAALLLSAPLAHAQSPAPRPGSITGTIVDRDTHQPVGQATVSIEGLKLGTLSDDEGRFTLRDVPAGSHRVRAWRLDYPAVILSDIVTSPGRQTQVAFELTGEAVQQTEVEVTASGFAKPKDQATSSYQMSYEEIRRSPGAIGDVFRLVQGLPGVVNSNDQRNDVVARGGSPSENLVLVDNIEVPSLNHFASQGTTGGPISMLNNELVRDASFLAGGYPAQYGQRLSSVMDIRLREGDRTRFQSATDVTVAGFNQLFEGPMTRKGSWLVSARTSYYDLVKDAFGIAAVPYATSVQAKFTYDVSAHDKFWLVNIDGHDNIRADFDPADTEDPYGVSFTSSGWRTVTGANWQHLFGTRGWGTLSLADAYGVYKQEYFDPYLGNALVFHNVSGEGESTLRYDLAGHLLPGGDWKAGVSAKRYRNSFDLSQPLGVQNLFSADTARVDAFAIDVKDATFAYSAYAQWSRPLARRTDVSLGVRADRFEVLNANSFDPRAALTTHVTPKLDVNLSWGIYHQLPALAFVTVIPSNRSLAPMRAEHYVAGLAYTPAPDFKLTLEAYRKNYQDYPVAAAYPQLSLANSGDIYGIAGLLFPMLSKGTGHAQGIEFYAQKKLTQGFYGQLSYSFSHSEHAALDGVMHRGGFDAPHTGTAILGYKRGAAWEFSTRFSYATGRPYTPALEPYSSQQNRQVLDLSRINAERALDYHRLDLRADRRFAVGRRNVTMWLEVQNIYDRENVLQMYWNAKTHAMDHLPQIAFLPVLGVNVQL